MILNPFLFGGSGAGGSGGISLLDASVYKFAYNQPATARYAIASNGNVLHDGIIAGQWIATPASASLYEVRATLQLGDPGQPTGTMNTWQQCNINRVWSVIASLGEWATATILVEIRDTATLTVRDSATITMNAESEYDPYGGGFGGQVPE